MAVTKGQSSFKKTIQDETRHEKLGDMLRKDGRITGRQLKLAEEVQKKKSDWIGNILIQLGFITEDALVNFISKNLTVAVFDAKNDSVSPAAVKLVEYKTAKDNMLIPVETDGKSLILAMRDPTNFKAIEFVAGSTKLSVKTKVIRLQDLADAYKANYKISDEEYKTLFPKKKEDEDKQQEEATSEVSFDLGEIITSAEEELEIAGDEDIGPDEITAGDAAIVKLVNGILINSVKKGSSDIHIEPYEKKLRVRYRGDGKLSEDMQLPLQMKNALISRIKIMANLNIAEKRVPQDGRIKIRIGGGKVVDFRVSVLPTLFGESVVMRLLDQSKLQVDMTRLGFSEVGLAKFNRAIEAPQGMVLVTGPTGSGKTNTLYSAINALNKEDVKILTAEDPVEFNFEGINQVQVRNEVGMTFAAALKAFLRQDPEIILVGEIRDIETAEIAIKAAMTGHLVFSTLHTNDCPSTIGRLLDIGIPGFMISSSLVMVVAQRLLRKMCPECKEEVNKYSPQQLLDMGFHKEELASLKIYQGTGCPKCNGGYKGRLGCFEIMEVNEELKTAITAQVPEDQLRKIAIKEGMKTLRRDGLDKVAEGITTIDEVLAKTVLQKEALPAYLLTPDELVFEDGDLIIREGNTDKNFYQLLQGALVIIKNGRVVGEITQPEEYFGEMSALLNQPRVATIKSKGKSVVKVFPGEKLEETLANHPDISLRIVKSLIGRLTEADRLLARLLEK
ncbi:MAG: type IV-A pilus assembly ATPase PilB [Nitrospinota bacterium]|nr:type IV-A pilus assembly ATPase PilB [Nitrospinota bacterium]